MHNISVYLHSFLLTTTTTNVRRTRQPWNMLTHVAFPSSPVQHMPSMSTLTALDFDNIHVTGALNPSPGGYHHGKHMRASLCVYAKHIQVLFQTTMLVTLTPLVLLQLQLNDAVSISPTCAKHVLTCTALPNVTPAQNIGKYSHQLAAHLRQSIC